MRALTAIAVLVLWTVAGVARGEAASDVTPLVDVAWVKAHTGHLGAVFLDIRNKLDDGSMVDWSAREELPIQIN